MIETIIIYFCLIGGGGFIGATLKANQLARTISAMRDEGGA